MREVAPMFAPYRIDTEVVELEYADFAFIGHGPNGDMAVGVERKTVRDILQCLRTGRFAGHQRDGLLESYPCVYLVIEGSYRPDPNTGVLQHYRGQAEGWCDVRLGGQRFMHAELERYLITLTAFTRIRVWHTWSITGTVRFIADLYHQLAVKQYADHRSLTAVHMPEIHEPVLLRPRTAEEENEVVRRMVVMSLKCGIGQDKSKEVARHFGSVRVMANADEREWARVDGVGKGIAQNAVAVIKNSLKEGKAK
jgi:ERCC4-type nuclease